MQDTDDAILGTYEEDRKMAKQYVSKLDLTPLLKIKDGEMIKNVFLQIPKSRSHEMAPLRKKLEDFKCVVYISRVEGHWDFFRKNFSTTQCLIVVHPSEMYLGTMPGLFNRLNKGSTVRVFSVGVQHQRCIEEDREPAYEALRLFPLGGITFITDDVFVYYPEMALQIIEDFLEKLKNKPIGGEHSKIGARPGVKDWLERLALQKYHEQECGDEDKDLRWIKCYDAICRLCPIEDEDPHFLPDRSVPLEHSFLWSINEDELPSFKGRWESGDEEGATDYMVELFAGEACISAWKYRRFIVVYQRPEDEKTLLDPQGAQVVQPDVDPRGWREKYCHIGVLTPEQYLSAQTAKK
jgi:chromo domain-containing protein 1